MSVLDLKFILKSFVQDGEHQGPPRGVVGGGEGILVHGRNKEFWRVDFGQSLNHGMMCTHGVSCDIGTEEERAQVAEERTRVRSAWIRSSGVVPSSPV